MQYKYKTYWDFKNRLTQMEIRRQITKTRAQGLLKEAKALENNDELNFLKFINMSDEELIAY